MTDQPLKPAGEKDGDGKVTPVEDRQAVKNQGEVKPEDYPEPASGKLSGDAPGS